jgi:hypothetical protein
LHGVEEDTEKKRKEKKRKEKGMLTSSFCVVSLS